jgi:phenylpyruvate tautomerase PptA (4-oxalocrotonate tautomerase family)
MPIVNIKIAGPTLAPEQICRLQLRTTEILVTALRAQSAASVLIERRGHHRLGRGRAPCSWVRRPDVGTAAGNLQHVDAARTDAEQREALTVPLVNIRLLKVWR